MRSPGDGASRCRRGTTGGFFSALSTGKEGAAKHRSTRHLVTPKHWSSASTRKWTDVPMGRKTEMDKMHGFTLILDGVPDLTEEVANRLFEAGCDDALPLWRDGIVSLGFDRTAPSLREAITSAIRDIESAGVGARVVRVEDATSGMAPEAISREVGSLNSALGAMTIIEMDPKLHPLMLNRLGIASA
jgi:hypothetical protein